MKVMKILELMEESFSDDELGSTPKVSRKRKNKGRKKDKIREKRKRLLQVSGARLGPG